VINDSLGHVVGDQLLIALAHRLETSLRSSDTVARLGSIPTMARLGGDEFTILLDEIHNVSDATCVAERLQQQLTMPFTISGHEVFTTASMGIALSATGYDRPEDILRDAETAMNLSHYESLDPNVHRSDRQKCLKACGNALPSHHQAPILLLEPGECPLGLEPRHHVFDGSPALFLGLPDPLGELRSYTTLA
jgi:diguanylate cyclase (GGDEF)-like protein